jgi:cyanophycinase
MAQATPGALYVIGGGEAKTGPCPVLARWAALVRQWGPTATLAVVTTATENPDAAYATYREAFTALGIRSVRWLAIDSRAEAERAAEQLDEELGGVFFTGGDQLRLTATLGGTAFHRRLVARQQVGLTVAGTSAGAAAMSQVMIVEGEADRMPTRSTVRMAAGLGLWPEAVIDQHFSQRGRIGRLLAALAQNPAVLGVGLDEDTALEVRADLDQAWVYGSGTATVLDGRTIRETNASDSRPAEPLALVDVRLHVLREGYGLRLSTRQPMRR